ncbi:hypothetical protein B0H17DRAFT_1207980 [Mycena rosella]|uniref:Protein kinase domain-containing protein n=1 Tax=Mycena rosella TaxID=1033263 RepID=A0AAD7D313_MYCRO|nr:hypothetical protein B0H17DRAFT_1207980 [Mycena rosella]
MLGVIFPPLPNVQLHLANEDDQLVNASTPRALVISVPNWFKKVKPSPKCEDKDTWLDEPMTTPPDAESSDLWSIKESDKICGVYDHSQFRYVNQGRFDVVYSTVKIGSDMKVAVKRMRFKDCEFLARYGMLSLHRKFEEETVKYITRQICATMAKVHEMNVVHRDVKPPNITVGDAGRHDSRFRKREAGVDCDEHVVRKYSTRQSILGETGSH